MFEANQQADSPIQFYPNQALEVSNANCFDDLSSCPEEWRYIPVNGNKVPWDYETNRELAWSEKEGYTAKQIQEMQPKAAGLILGERSLGVGSIDFDGPGSEEEFQRRFGRPSTDLPSSITWTSGKPDRRQIAFSVPSAWQDKLRQRKWKQSGSVVLEARFPAQGSNLQSVIAGQHPETDGYRWVKGCSPREVAVAEAPDWLLEVLLEPDSYLPKFPKPQKDLSDAEQELNKDKALEALRCLPAADFEDYDSWLKVGMALHSVDEGFLSNWVEWCRPMSNFDEPEFVQKWESFSEKEPGEGVGIGTLIKEAKKHGYSEPVRAIAPPERGGLPGLIEAVGSFQELDENGEQRPAPRMNAGAVMTLLEKRLGSHLKLNDLARVYEFDGVALPEDETMVSYADMQQKGWNIEQKAWLDGLLRVAQKYRYDPVLDYLQYLEKAADVEPIDINKIATNYLDTESDLSDQMMKVALLGAVARRFEPGCQFDSVVVLKGDQGIRKSTFWKTLCSPAWFCDSTPNDTKEMKMNMHSCWIFELAELENVTSKKGVGELKAIITIASDMIKKPYGRNVERDDRRSIMVASVNGDDFLRDPSGNRRFQVVSLPQKAQKKDFIPVELVARDRDRIWKAAIDAYRAGEKPMLSLEHQELSNQQNKGYLPEDLWEQDLDKWLSGKAGCQTWIPENQDWGYQKESPKCFTTVDALKGLGFGLNEERKLGRREEMRMAALLQTKGFLKDAQQKTINGVRGYYWHQSE